MAHAGDTDDNMRFWDRASKHYTSMQEKSNSLLFDRMAELSSGYVRDRMVLEIACGTGQMTSRLSKLAESYTATDFSERMVKEAEDRGMENAVLEVQDATALDYGDCTFDTVIIANALHIMPDPDTALKEIRRVLRPDGVLIAPTFVYEGRIRRIRLFFIRLAGFRTFHKWDMDGYVSYVCGRSFSLAEKEVMPAVPLSEGFAVFRKA